jgi:hypothetical protein
MLTYADVVTDVCWRMLAELGVHWRYICVLPLLYVSSYCYMCPHIRLVLVDAVPEQGGDVCSRMLTHADVCRRMLTYADVC